MALLFFQDYKLNMSYLPVVILFFCAVVIGVVILILTSVLGKSHPHPLKNKPFECGFIRKTNTNQRIPVRFFLIAILFLLFDVEVVFFYPLAIAYKKYLHFNLMLFWEMMVFITVLLVGYFYVLRKKVFEWE
jgi:NADH-quinone oxidoreductase subunit A